MFYFYARVSTKAQNEDRQLIALKEFEEKECADERSQTFIDKMTGSTFERLNYKRMYTRLREGDVIVVKSIDRLGRDYNEILEEWRKITKVKNCDIVILDMPLLDTRRGKDLTGTLIADIVLQLLSYVAETERQFIRQRVIEGVEAAKERGVRFGRPAMEKPAEFEALYERYRSGNISSRRAGEKLGTSHVTFMKWVHESETGYMKIVSLDESDKDA